LLFLFLSLLFFSLSPHSHSLDWSVSSPCVHLPDSHSLFVFLSLVSFFSLSLHSLSLFNLL
jgi:hypothetical protein